MENARIGNGLSNMRARAVKHKGKLDIISAPGKGCAIKSIIPIPRVPYFAKHTQI